MAAIIPDFSVIDSMVGVVAGFSLLLIFIILGFKYGFICFAPDTTKAQVVSSHGIYCIDPAKCVAHQAEQERSQANKASIAKLDAELHGFKVRIFDKLDHIEEGISTLNVKVAELHARQ